MQQVRMTSGLVPTLSTQAGSSLTLANWENAAVTSVSVNLVDLLMKPGLAVLETLSDIRDFCRWPYTIILNALLPPPDREDRYSFRSIYDGGLVQIDAHTLFELIGRLKPDIVILPEGSASYFCQFRTLWPVGITALLHLNDNLPEIPRYRMFESRQSFAMFCEELEDKTDTFYLIGDFDFFQIKQLKSYGKYLIESDTPAKDGMTGMVYDAGGPFNILDTSMTNDSRLIDETCQCLTCNQKFTRAYLHHLLQQTPLLAQRYLIQHNVWYCQNYLEAG